MSSAYHGIRFLVTALAVLMLFAGTSMAVKEPDLLVNVKTKAQVKKEKIFLKDIAVITGPEVALKNELGQVYITRAPNPGQSINIRKDYLIHRLRLTGLPLNLVKWSLPRMVHVSRESQTIKPALVKKIFKAYLSSNSPYRDHDWELVKLQVGALPCLPAGSLTYKIIPCPSVNPNRLSLIIYFFVDEKEEGRIRVTGQINLFQEVLVAAQTIEKGQVIKAGDVKMARVNLGRLREAALSSPEQAIGYINGRHRLHPGQPILSSDLKKPIEVKRGDIITIIVECGTLRVTTVGQAKKDGAKGDKIPVLNLDSKKVVMARVISSNLAQIDL